MISGDRLLVGSPLSLTQPVAVHAVKPSSDPSAGSPKSIVSVAPSWIALPTMPAAPGVPAKLTMLPVQVPLLATPAAPEGSSNRYHSSGVGGDRLPASPLPTLPPSLPPPPPSPPVPAMLPSGEPGPPVLDSPI